jgi:outer membrane protein
MPAWRWVGQHRRAVRYSVSALALFVAISRGAHAQSMQDALVSAYANNPTLLAERAQLRATDENVPQALSNWRPTVSISSSVGYSRTSANGPSTTNLSGTGGILPSGGDSSVTSSLTGYGTSNLHPSTYGLTVNQPVFRGFRTVEQTAQAVDEVRAERANLVTTEQSVFLSVITDYMNVVEQQATVDLNVNNEQVLRRQLEATQDQFRVGEKTRTDVAQAEASYSQAIANRQSAEGQLQVYRAAYQHDVGDLPGKLVAPTSFPLLPTTRDEATDLALQAAPAVIEAQYTQTAAQHNVNVIKGALLPTISLQGTVQRSNDPQTPSGTRIDEEQVLAQLTMPLYEAGATYSQARAAQQTVEQRTSQLDDARRVAVQNAGQAWEELQSTRATIKSLKDQVHAAEVALDGVQQEAAVGSRTILDILNQEQTLFTARVNLVQSQRDEIVYEFTLAQSVGRLDAKSLGLPVEYYDPDKNYDAVRNKWIGFGSGD